MNTLATNSKHKIPLALSLLSAGPAVEIGEDYELLDINALVTRGREGFIAYPVTGDSMIEGIQPGSVVFVDPYAEPRNGSIVAASVNGAICVKTFQIRERKLYLVPQNTKYPSKEIREADNLHILGVVKGNLNLY